MFSIRSIYTLGVTTGSVYVFPQYWPTAGTSFSAIHRSRLMTQVCFAIWSTGFGEGTMSQHWVISSGPSREVRKTNLKLANLAYTFLWSRAPAGDETFYTDFPTRRCDSYRFTNSTASLYHVLNNSTYQRLTRSRDIAYVRHDRHVVVRGQSCFQALLLTRPSMVHLSAMVMKSPYLEAGKQTG